MSYYGDKKRKVDAYWDDNFVPGMFDALESVVKLGQDEIVVLAKKFVHKDEERLEDSIRKFKPIRTYQGIFGRVRAGGKKVRREMVDYAFHEEAKHPYMRPAAKHAAPGLRTELMIRTAKFR